MLRRVSASASKHFAPICNCQLKTQFCKLLTATCFRFCVFLFNFCSLVAWFLCFWLFRREKKTFSLLCFFLALFRARSFAVSLRLVCTFGERSLQLLCSSYYKHNCCVDTRTTRSPSFDEPNFLRFKLRLLGACALAPGLESREPQALQSKHAVESRALFAFAFACSVCCLQQFASFDADCSRHNSTQESAIANTWRKTRFLQVRAPKQSPQSDKQVGSLANIDRSALFLLAVFTSNDLQICCALLSNKQATKPAIKL